MVYFNPEKFPERIEKNVRNMNVENLNDSTEKQDEFLMSPKVDFCFKELMQNAKVGSTV